MPVKSSVCRSKRIATTIVKTGVFKVSQTLARDKYQAIYIVLVQLLIAVLICEARAIDIFTRGSEIALGQSIAKKIESQIPLWEDQEQLSRVRRIGMSILSVCERKDMPYEFKILNIDEPNALALPGGFVYLTRGLVEVVISDDELAFVIAHEVGHVVGRHARKAISQDTIISVLASILLGGASQIVRTAADVLYTLQRLGYSRNQEREADNFALKYIKAAGYNPVGAITMLSKFSDQRLRGLERYFSTHPDAGERIQRLAKQLGIKLPTTLQKDQMQSLLRTPRQPFLTQPICFVRNNSIHLAYDENTFELWSTGESSQDTKSKIIWYQASPKPDRVFALTATNGSAYARIIMISIQPNLSTTAQPLATISLPQGEWEHAAMSPDGKMLAAISCERDLWQLVLLDVERMKSILIPIGEGRTPNGSMIWQAPHERVLIPVVSERHGYELLSCDAESGQIKSVQGWHKLRSSLNKANPQAHIADLSLLIISAEGKDGKIELIGFDEKTGAAHELSANVLRFVVGQDGKRFAFIRMNGTRQEIWVGELPQAKPKTDMVKLLRSAISEAMPVETREGTCAAPCFSSDGEMLAYAIKPCSDERWEVWVVNMPRRQAQRIASDATTPQFIQLQSALKLSGQL